MQATREEFLSARAKQKVVTLPELGGKTVVVHQPGPLTLANLDAADYVTDAKGNSRFDPAGRSIRWTIACTFDEKGQAMFTDADAKALEPLMGTLVRRCFEAAWEMGNISPAAVEGEAKNS